MQKTLRTGFKLATLAALTMSANIATATIDANVGSATNIDSYDVALGGTNFLNDINQLNWTGFILSDFGATGAPNVTNSTFTDYIVLNLQTATTASGGTQSSCLNSTCEVTAVIQASGIITDGTTGAFSFTGLTSFDVFLDTGVIGADVVTNFNEYFDGTKVLASDTLAYLTQSPAPDPNTGALAPTVGAGGSFNFQSYLTEVASFLLSADGSQSLFDAVAPELIAQLTEGQITLQALQAGGTLTCAGNGDCTDVEQPAIDNFVTKFGISDSSTLTLTLVQSSPTTNVASNAVPVPAALGLLGIGFLGFAGINRRRREMTRN